MFHIMAKFSIFRVANILICLYFRYLRLLPEGPYIYDVHEGVGEVKTYCYETTDVGGGGMS